MGEKEQLEGQLRSCREKIDDLKYNNQELKNLNEKSTLLYEKELNMLRKESTSH